MKHHNAKQRSVILTITTVIAAALWGACGGGGSSAAPTPTAPTVSSVTITGGSAVPSATSLSTTAAITNVSTATSAFTITFSEAMNPTTITTSTVTLTCGGTAQTYTVSETSTTVFTVTPTAALSQIKSCILTIGTGVESADGTALAAAVVYDFNTSCATDDLFTNAATIVSGTGCWTPGNVQGTVTSSIASATNGLTESATTAASGPTANVGGLVKDFGGEDIVTSIQITGTGGLGDNGNGFCAFYFGNTFSLGSTAGLFIILGKDGTGALGVGLADLNNHDSSGIAIAPVSTTTPLTVTFTRTGANLIATYTYNGASGTLPQDNGITIGTLSDTAVVSGPAVVGSVNESTVTCTFSTFTTNSISATGPVPTGATGGQD